MTNPVGKPFAVGLCSVLLGLWIGCEPLLAQAVGGAETANSKQFQTQELVPHRSIGWVFPQTQPPRLIWRDAEEVKRLGGESPPKVRWFDRDLMEAEKPNHAGRWIALVEGLAPNGTPLRRAHTFYCLPEKPDLSGFPDLSVHFPNFPNDKTPALVREYQAEIERSAKEMVGRGLLDNERAAILIAAITESQALGRPRRFAESALVQHAERHLALKLQMQRLKDKVKPLDLPRQLDSEASEPTPKNRLSPERVAEARQRISGFCRQWVEATGEPFVVQIVLDGQVIIHEAFGRGPDQQPIDLKYRCWIASLTKTVTGLMFARFLDQGLVDLDASLSTVFPDFPANSPNVPTFRQCLNHTAGFEGLADFGGMNHPYYENVVLNAIELNEPGKAHRYSGVGYELVAKAMENISGQTAVTLFDQQLFTPLGFGDVVLGNASSDAELTAGELAVLGQLMANQGTYGGREYFRPETMEKLLPRMLDGIEGAPPTGYGVGLHWVNHQRVKTETSSNPLPASAPSPSLSKLQKGENDQLFSPRTIGHGSLSGCILVVDLESKLVIAQARKQFRDADNEWWAKFFQVVANSLE